MLEVGTKAPDFTLPDQDGEDVSLSGLAGTTVVLYFYPKADTLGQTTVMVTHDAHAAAIADRVLFLADGTSSATSGAHPRTRSSPRWKR
jgi:peroxiredoxin